MNKLIKATLVASTMLTGAAYADSELLSYTDVTLQVSGQNLQVRPVPSQHADGSCVLNLAGSQSIAIPATSCTSGTWQDVLDDPRVDRVDSPLLDLSSTINTPRKFRKPATTPHQTATIGGLVRVPVTGFQHQGTFYIDQDADSNPDYVAPGSLQAPSRWTFNTAPVQQELSSETRIRGENIEILYTDNLDTNIGGWRYYTPSQWNGEASQIGHEATADRWVDEWFLNARDGSDGIRGNISWASGEAQELKDALLAHFNPPAPAANRPDRIIFEDRSITKSNGDIFVLDTYEIRDANDQAGNLMPNGITLQNNRLASGEVTGPGYYLHAGDSSIYYHVKGYTAAAQPEEGSDDTIDTNTYPGVTPNGDTFTLRAITAVGDADQVFTHDPVVFNFINDPATVFTGEVTGNGYYPIDPFETSGVYYHITDYTVAPVNGTDTETSNSLTERGITVQEWRIVDAIDQPFTNGQSIRIAGDRIIQGDGSVSVSSLAPGVYPHQGQVNTLYYVVSGTLEEENTEDTTVRHTDWTHVVGNPARQFQEERITQRGTQDDSTQERILLANSDIQDDFSYIRAVADGDDTIHVFHHLRDTPADPLTLEEQLGDVYIAAIANAGSIETLDGIQSGYDLNGFSDDQAAAIDARIDSETDHASFDALIGARRARLIEVAQEETTEEETTDPVDPTDPTTDPVDPTDPVTPEEPIVEEEEEEVLIDTYGPWTPWVVISTEDTTDYDAKVKYLTQTGTVTKERTRELLTSDGDDTNNQDLRQTRTDTVRGVTYLNPAWAAANNALNKQLGNDIKYGQKLSTTFKNGDKLVLNLSTHGIEFHSTYVIEKEGNNIRITPRVLAGGIDYHAKYLGVGVDVNAEIAMIKGVLVKAGFDSGDHYTYYDGKRNGFKFLKGTGETDSSFYTDATTEINGFILNARVGTDNTVHTSVSKGKFSFGSNTEGQVTFGYKTNF